MRIIAGLHRGRQLQAPEGLATRPMTDRVRENLFNILGHRVEHAAVLDLFCGSGALGLEALSRGATFCLFVDSDACAFRATRANCEALGLADRARIARHDALHPGPWTCPPDGTPYSLVFVDPPYKITDAQPGREQMAAMTEALVRLGCLAPDATVILRVRKGTPMDVGWPGFEARDERTYGTTTLHLMVRTGDEETG